MKKIFSAILAFAAIISQSCSGREENKAPTQINFYQSSYQMAVGTERELKVNFFPSGTSGELSWTSNAPSVASVDTKGKVSAIKEGSAKITASCGKLSCSCTVNVGNGEPEDDRPGFMVRVMQFNVRESTAEVTGNEWSVRKQPCINMLNQLSPDIVCCQEARKEQCTDFENAFTGSYEQVKHPKDNNTAHAGQRNLIMYRSEKYEVLDWDKYWFSVDETASGVRFCPSGTNSGSKTTQKMTIYVHFREKTSKRDFYVFCTHFFADVDDISQRNKCVELSLKHVKAIPSETPVFFCGDLNLNYNSEDARKVLSPLFDYMQSAGVSATSGDSYSTPTYNNFEVGNRKDVLDYIFYRNATAVSYKVVNGSNYGTTFISDHFPVYSDFRVGKVQ